MLGSLFCMMLVDCFGVLGLWEMFKFVFFCCLLRMVMVEVDKLVLLVLLMVVYFCIDGVVWWYICIDIEDEIYENFEVWGSYSGLGWNLVVLVVLVDWLV